MPLLIQHDADPNILYKEGRTALHWSCNNGNLDAVKLLLGCGSFPNHMEHTEERKREEERRREAVQQLSLAEGDQKQLVSLTAARVENCHWMKRSRVLKIQWW
ncbi:hypothetical protein cypCar_00005007 [Cyprinus carpio]|nr:hypothetical protein cypCar_00005007 [Cyprinus carpio]